MMFRKTAIIIGGSTGEFGPILAKRMSKAWIKRWNVINIDTKANPDCQHNFVVDFKSPIGINQMRELHYLIKAHSQEVDAMVNVVSASNVQCL